MFPASDRDLELMLSDRGVVIGHATISAGRGAQRRPGAHRVVNHARSLRAEMDALGLDRPIHTCS